MELPRVHLSGACVPVKSHYREDGDLNILAETALFKVLRKDVLPRSVSLSTIAERCREQEQNWGRALNTAIRVLNLTPKQMSCFFDYIAATTPPSPTPAASAPSTSSPAGPSSASAFASGVAALHKLEETESYASLHDLLHACSAFLVPDGRLYALGRLNVLPGITAFQKLHIACDYNVPEWFKPAAKIVLLENPRTWSDDQVALISSFMPALLTIRAQFDNLRSQLIYEGPVWHPATPNCPEGCKAKFASVWLATRPILLEKTMGGPVKTAVWNALHDAAKAQGICAKCVAELLFCTVDALNKELDEVELLIDSAFKSRAYDDEHETALKTIKRSGYDIVFYERTGRLRHRGEL